MHMKRATIKIVIDVPVKQDPWKYVTISGGQLVNVSEKSISSMEELGDVDTPWAQKDREFYAVRQIIQDGYKAAVNNPLVSVVVRGSRRDTPFTYYIDVNPTKKLAEQIGEADMYSFSPKWERWLKQNYPGVNKLAVSLENGVLRFDANPWGDRKVVATMSVGNPKIVEEIATFLKNRFKPLSQR